MKQTRVNAKGQTVISAEYAHHLATAPFSPRHHQPPSYLWAGAGIARPLIGSKVRQGRVSEEDVDVYEDDNLTFIN